MIGVDYHPSFQQIAFFMEETGEYSERRLNHSDGEAEQVSIELLGLPIAVVQSSFAIFAGLLHQKCNLLKARVIIYAYHHVRLLPPEPLVVKQPQSTRVEGADTVMQSSGNRTETRCRLLDGSAWWYSFR